jgi:Flp pilus assembly protein CpaB
MKPKTMILAVVAIGCGLAASYMTSKLLAEKKAPPPEEKIDIVVATKNVPKLTVLKDPAQFFEIRQRTKSEAPEQYFGTLEEIKDKRLTREVTKDSHLSPDDISAKALTALPIPDGYGGISLRITATSAVGYFVFPGDKVDIILVERGEQPSSQTILRDVLVLSVGTAVVKAEDGAVSAQQANNINVALKSDEAQLVKLAESVGELSLFLRREGDESMELGGVTTLESLKRAVAKVARKNLEKTDELPFGTSEWVGPALKEPETKTEPVVTPEPVKPEWTVTIRVGDDVKKVDFFKDATGSAAVEPSGQETKKQPDTQPTKEPEKKPEKKPATKPDTGKPTS